MNNRKNKNNKPQNTSDNNKGSSNINEYNSIPSNRFYTAKEEVTLRFYQVPKALFENSACKGLSLGAKLMFSILRDRLDVSIKNEWEDENGYIYLIFTVDEIEEILEVTRKTAIKHKKELKNFGLIIDKRVGQGNPNRIYVLKPLLTEFQKCKNSTSRSVKCTPY